jgi:hypothetical protein
MDKDTIIEELRGRIARMESAMSEILSCTQVIDADDYVVRAIGFECDEVKEIIEKALDKKLPIDCAVKINRSTRMRELLLEMANTIDTENSDCGCCIECHRAIFRKKIEELLNGKGE